MKVIYIIVLILVLIGALNRWAIGFFDFNAVTWLANMVHPAITDPETAEIIANPLVEKCSAMVYNVIWVAAIALLGLKIFGCKNCCKK